MTAVDKIINSSTDVVANELHKSLENAKLVSLAIDISGRIVFANNALQSIMNIDSEGLLGRDMFDVFSLEAENTFNRDDFLDRLRKDGINESLRVVHKLKEDEIHFRLSPIPSRNNNGDITSVTFIGENITERQRVRHALEKTNIQLKELFDNSSDLIQIFNSEWVIRFANEAWKNKLGYSDKDLESLTLEEIVDSEHWDETKRKLEKIAQGEEVEKFETVLVSKYGKNVFVSGKIHCTKERDIPIEYRGIFYDISERVRAEKAQSLFYKIANLTTTSYNLDILYASIYLQLNSILKIQNFAVALKEGGDIRFPYFISESQTGGEIKEYKELGKLLAEYTFERKKPLIIYEDGIRRIAKAKRLKIKSPLPLIWLGVQLIIEGEPKGVISFHSFQDRPAYNFKDLELLDFISSQMAMAIERKLQELQIKDQNARIKAIFESSTHEIWSIDRNYNITSFNQNYADTLDKYYGLNVEKLLWGQTIDKFESAFGIDWVSHYEKAFNGDAQNFQTELADNSGNRLWRDVFINPIFDTDSKVKEVSVIANDVTEKKLSETALAESEEKFRTIFESIQDIYFRCDLSGNIVMISPSAAEMLGFELEELMGKDINQFYQLNSGNGSLFDQLSENQRIKNLEATLTTKSGDEIQCLCNVRMILQKGKPYQIEGVARDITQIRRAYEELESAKDLAERSLKVKERFLANMSHEIRTPMNGIIGMIDLIASTKLDGEQKDYIKTIKKSSETLLHILNDILDLSKIEAGKMELRNDPVALENTFEKLYDLFSRQAHVNDNSLYYHLADNLPEIVFTDETRLLQILSNLTSNAIKFSKSGGTIHISAKEIERGNDISTVRVQIKDSGIGISMEDQKKLFTSFTQVDNSSTKLYSGTGLGLAISKELTKSMRGDIGVHSTLGLGSTFWFTFKSQIATGEVKPYDPTQVESDFKNEFENKKPYLLVVDDNSVNRKVACQILKKAGCHVDEVSSGTDAIDQVRKNSYDLIFMDIQMPVMDGIKAAEEIRNLGLERTPPIVAMTAYSMQEDRTRFLSQGMDDYLAKPIKATELVKKVKNWLNFEPLEVKTIAFKEDGQENGGLIINQNTLSSLSRHGGKGILKPILEDFDRETREQLVNCFKALERDDLEAVRTELHTLKGSAGTLGIERVAEYATKLEGQLKKGRPKDLNKKLQVLEERFKEFQDNAIKIFDDPVMS